MRTAFLILVLAGGLAGCRYAPHDGPTSCERFADWADRKACKEKLATEEKEWEKRQK